MTVTNPVPAVGALQVTAQPFALVFRHTPGPDLDYEGIIIAVRQGADPDPVVHRVFKGRDASITIEELADESPIIPDTEYRYSYAAYDAFGEVGIIWNGPGIVTTPGEVYGGVVGWNQVTGTGKPADNADVTAANTAAGIAGQGALATKSVADWGSDVTGTGKPADNADVTAANTAAGIAGQGALATRSKTTWHQDEVPTSGMIEGDLWVDTNDGNKLYRYSGIAWIGIQDQEILAAMAAAATAQSTADGRIVSFFEAATPAGGKLGDLWFDTDDDNRLYRHNGTSWALARDDGISQAITNAATAQSTADGKITTFYALSSSPPASPDPGDLWYVIDTREIKIRQSGVWVTAGDVTAEKIAAGIAGQGALATKSAADWGSDVTGTGKPADNADVTAANTAAGIAGQGAFATLSQVTPGNIATYVAPLTVDTPRIQDAAITDTATAQSFNQVDLTGFTLTEILSLAVTTAGGRVLVQVIVRANVDALLIQVTDNDVEVWTTETGSGPLDSEEDSIWSSPSFNRDGLVSFPFTYVPAAGLHTLKLKVYAFTSQNIHVRFRALIVTEIKK